MQQKKTKGISHGLATEAADKDKLKFYKDIFRVKKFNEDYSGDEYFMINDIIYDKNQEGSKELYDKKEIILYGSHIFKGNVLSGDIDVMQLININEQVKALQWVMNNLLYTKLEDNNLIYFLGDIKCGLVTKFKSLASYIGTFKDKKVIGYDYDACKYAFNLSNDFTESGLILPKKVETKKEIIEYLKVYQLAHDLITRRWTPQEIIQGYQVEEDNKEYSLNQAVRESQLTKYDFYCISNNLYIECTNTFIDNSKTEEKNIKNDFKSGVILNMLIQYYVKDNKLKALKRMYALARMDKNINLCLLLHDLTQRSLVGKYNQIINHLKVFIFILENYSGTFALNPNKQRFKRLAAHIKTIQTLIQKLYTPYDKYLTIIIDELDQYIIRHNVLEGDSEKVKIALIYCNKIIEYFTKKIDKLCIEFIKSNNINFSDYL